MMNEMYFFVPRLRTLPGAGNQVCMGFGIDPGVWIDFAPNLGPLLGIEIQAYSAQPRAWPGWLHSQRGI
jgi:hypothetical protein